MKQSGLILSGLIGILALGLMEVKAQEPKPYVGSEAFEQMKQLVGSWEGTIDMGKGPEKITASYKLTSGGSAIIETVFEGEEHEMVTVYHDDSHKKLNMTHYCMLANQPKMTLKGTEKNALTFNLSEDADIDVAKDTHMNSLVIQWEDNDRMTQRWMQLELGKEKKVVEIAYKRIM